MNELLEFVRPYYQTMDIMHDLSHINGVLTEVDQVVITYAAYFHGFIYSRESEIFQWLSEQKLNQETSEKMIEISWGCKR